MNNKATPSFAHEPRTEQEVVCLFGALLQHLDPPLMIELGFPFSRLSAGDSFPQLVRDLNDAFGNELIAVKDSTRKGIGGDVSRLFPTAELLRKFLVVWQSFATQHK